MAGTVIECPYCQAQLVIPDESMWYACEKCEHGLNVRAQRAFTRASTLFFGAQEPAAELFRRRRGRVTHGTPDSDAVLGFQQAHNALQVAFQFDLPDSQRIAGIEMMTEITRLFLMMGMISPLEASYWSRLLLECNTQRELDELDATLSGPAGRGPRALFRRWRQQLRRRQLIASLSRLDRQIRQAEQAMEFVDPPRARRKKP